MSSKHSSIKKPPPFDENLSSLRCSQVLFSGPSETTWLHSKPSHSTPPRSILIQPPISHLLLDPPRDHFPIGSLTTTENIQSRTCNWCAPKRQKRLHFPHTACSFIFTISINDCPPQWTGNLSDMLQKWILAHYLMAKEVDSKSKLIYSIQQGRQLSIQPIMQCAGSHYV